MSVVNLYGEESTAPSVFDNSQTNFV